MFITAADLTPFVGSSIDAVRLTAMIADAEAFAISVAPCLTTRTLTDHERALVKAVLRRAISRWAEFGTGDVVSNTAGPYSTTVDTRRSRSAMFTDGEREQLQGICSGSASGAAYSVDTVGGPGVSGHPPYCSIMFRGPCSCGLSFVGAPIYYEPDE